MRDHISSQEQFLEFTCYWENVLFYLLAFCLFLENGRKLLSFEVLWRICQTVLDMECSRICGTQILHWLSRTLGLLYLSNASKSLSCLFSSPSLSHVELSYTSRTWGPAQFKSIAVFIPFYLQHNSKVLQSLPPKYTSTCCFYLLKFSDMFLELISMTS